jgi:Xaa-Pro dipeptidase
MGVDGHDGLVHLVKGNKRPLQEGMCFSNEPMLVIPDKYGIRIEDDFYMTAEGAKYFSHPPESIDNPV